MPIQLSFSIRVSSSVKAVHLIGSWDGYVNQLPLSRDKSSSKSGAWKATFRFSSSQLKAGERHWYYYILDGHNCAHNPGLPTTVEPTTGRELNILDVPAEESKKSSSSSKKSSSKTPTLTLDIPRGRPLSVSEIKAPKPVSPSQTKHILTFPEGEMEDLSVRLARSGLSEEDEYRHYVPNDRQSPAPLSPISDSSSDDEAATFSDLSESCSCERYGLTRSGQRVRIDCGGSICGFGYESDCSIPESRDYSSRRRGIVLS